VDEFNIKTALGEMHRVFKNQLDSKNLQFRMDIDPALDRYFNSDVTRLKQVLTNLIGNASKFTDKGGVTVTARQVSSNSELAEVYFGVEDTGIGMTTAEQNSIFEAFNQAESSTTRRYGGTGLGLTISKKIVEKMGGQLEFRSEKGIGSCFSFTIKMPIVQNHKNYVNENKVSALQSLKGAKVLIAEDSHVNMTITRKFLQRWDVEIDEAENGLIALEKFRNNKYDVLLIDLDMPVMDGFQALAEIRKVNDKIPAIAFTAAVLPQMKEFLASKGFNDFLQKPFRPEDLHNKISKYRA
jgi:CheY-like chemotaxis protein/two-component sensor histidine kinase